MHDHGRLHPSHRDRLEPPIAGRQRSVGLAVLCLCALVAGIDMTVTNIALPFIGRDLDAGINGLQWAVDAFTIFVAGLLVLGGALGDRFGRRRVFLVGLAVFGAGSAIAAFSVSIEMLVAARSIMGVGAAAFTAPALALIASMYPPDQRAGAIGVFVVFGATGLAVGPVMGGLLLDQFWWGSVFLVNVPIVAVGVVLGTMTIPESTAPAPPGGRPPLDVFGALLSVVGLAGLLFGIIEGPNRGWGSAAVIVGLVVGVVVITWFVRRELRAESPLFDVRILRRPAVLTGSITLFMAYVLFNGFLFLNPQYLQDVLDESIVDVGLLFVPFAVVFGICSLQAPKVVARLGARAAITVGLLIGSLACVLFAIALGGALWTTVVASVVLAVGLSMLIAPPSTVVMNDLPETKAGDGSSLNFVSRFVGASVGVAIVGSVLATIYAEDLDVSALDGSKADTATASLQGALEVSGTLDPAARQRLTESARSAFDSGATVAYLVVAVVVLLAAALAWGALGRSATATERSEDEVDPRPTPPGG